MLLISFPLDTGQSPDALNSYKNALKESTATVAADDTFLMNRAPRALSCLLLIALPLATWWWPTQCLDVDVTIV